MVTTREGAGKTGGLQMGSHRAFLKGTGEVHFPLHPLTPERFHFYPFPMLGFHVGV